MKTRFTSSPDVVRVKGGYADCNHPTARAFSVINRRCVLMTRRIHPFIFHALQGCHGKGADDIMSILGDYGVSAYPDLPTNDDLAWFNTHFTGDVGRLRELTCSGRGWQNIETDIGTASVISFWSNLEDVFDPVLYLILEALRLEFRYPAYVEFIDSMYPIRVRHSAEMRRAAFRWPEPERHTSTDGLEQNDVAMLTAFHGQAQSCALYRGVEKGHVFTHAENKDRNKQLHATLLRLNYGVTKIDGSYLEDFGASGQTEVGENTFFVVNLNDDPAFADNIVKLGEFYCQDSVFVKLRGESAYLMGTNYAEFPGYHRRVELPKFCTAQESEFMTRIRERAVFLDALRNYNVGAKFYIGKTATPVIEALELKIQPKRTQNAE